MKEIQNGLSKIVLGTAYFGTDIDEMTSFAIMDKYFEMGGRSLDTARVYGKWGNPVGYSEEVIGKWITERQNRNNLFIVTKGGHPNPENMEKSRLSRSDIYNDINISLSMLKCDYANLYLLHRDDQTKPVGEIMDVMHDLVLEGKTRAIGVSNWTFDRISEANEYAKSNGKTPLTVSQIQWSLAYCTPQSMGDETLICMNDDEYAKYLNSDLTIMAFSPQAKGLFSKAISQGADKLNQKIYERFYNDINKERIEKVREYCDKNNVSPAAVCLAYITCNPLPATAIIGCSNVAQIIDSMTTCAISEEDLVKLI